jgi:transposase InsO family protein
MTTKMVGSWLTKLGAKIIYIEPGSPWENGYCESFNGKLATNISTGRSSIV